MNKFGKILTGTLSVVLGVGAVGGVCYSTIPSFKNRVNEIVRKDKVSIKNDANIGDIDKGPDLPTPDNPNEVKPISPDEFKSTYKVDLPASFLGGNLYVKKLSNDNLLISSDISTGILKYDVQSATVEKIELAYNSWKHFAELPNGDVLMASSNSGCGLWLLNSSTLDCSQILSGNFFKMFKLSSGDYLASIGNSSYLFSVEDYSIAKKLNTSVII